MVHMDVTMDDGGVDVDVYGVGYTSAQVKSAIAGATLTPAQVGTASDPVTESYTQSLTLGSESPISGYAGALSVDSNDNLVATDTDTQLSQSDVLGLIDGASISPGELSVSGSPAAKALNSSSSPTVHQSFRTSVPATTSQAVFSVQNPVDVIGGTVNGPNTANVTATWEDGTMTDISGGIPQGTNGSDGYYATVSIPPLENVTKLEFINSKGTTEAYGWSVVTV